MHHSEQKPAVGHLPEQEPSKKPELPSENHTAKLEARAAEYLAGWQRAQADYQNLLRQTEKDKHDIGTFAKASVLVQLVPILENFRRAFQHVPDGEKSAEWLKGLGHTMKQLEQLLASNGLEEIPAAGEQFDPHVHEAIAREKREGIASGVILTVLESGWKLGDDVLVPSKVVVAE